MAEKETTEQKVARLMRELGDAHAEMYPHAHEGEPVRPAVQPAPEGGKYPTGVEGGWVNYFRGGSTLWDAVHDGAKQLLRAGHLPASARGTVEALAARHQDITPDQWSECGQAFFAAVLSGSPLNECVVQFFQCVLGQVESAGAAKAGRRRGG